MAMRVRLPLDSFNGFTLTFTLSESNNMSNNNDKLTIDGFPNLRNDQVLAALLDTVGINLTNIVNAITLRAMDEGRGEDALITIDQVTNLIAIQGLLQGMRQSVPVDHTRDEVHELTRVILDEMDAHKKAYKASLAADAAKIRAFAKELGIEDYAEEFLREQGIAPSVSDAADEILRDLRETGTIGGSRAV